MKEKKHNFHEQEFFEHLQRFRNGTDITPSDFLGVQLMTLCEDVLTHRHFVHFSPSVKEEMKSHALVNLVNGLSHYKMQYGAQGLHRYFTRICFTSFLFVCKKYYKAMNLRWELEHESLVSQGYSESQIEEKIGKRYEKPKDKNTSECNPQRKSKQVGQKKAN